MILNSDCKLLFVGDSITDCGRRFPVGDASTDTGLGDGYVRLVNALLTATYPEKRVQVLNTGISGNTVRDLSQRWQEDVLSLNPDWLSIMIGINDVWRQYDGRWPSEQCISPDEFESSLEKLILQIRSQLKGLVLMSPYHLQPDKSDPMRQTMDQYSAIVRKLADKHKAIFADTQAAFDTLLQHISPSALSNDRIHMGTIGHMTLARTFLHAIGYLF